MQLRRRRKSNTEILMDHVTEIAERASDLGGQAVVAIAPRIEDARDAALVVYSQARNRVTEEYVPKVRDEYVPRVREEVGQRVRDDVLPKARAAAASPMVAAALAKSPLRLPEPAPVKKTHRLRNGAVALGLGGGGAFAFSKLRAGSTPSTPPPPPAPPRPTAVPDPVPAAPPSSDVSVGVDSVSGFNDLPVTDDLGTEVVSPEQPDDRRPGDPI